IRMQPCDAREPIDHSSAVPWIPTEPFTPSQRALSGLFGAPPGIVWPRRLPAQSLFGTCHAGLTCLLWIENVPVGVSNPAAPIAMPYVLASLRRLKSRSL